MDDDVPVAAADALCTLLEDVEPVGLMVPVALPVALKAADMEKGADVVGELEGEPLELAVEDVVPVAAADAL